MANWFKGDFHAHTRRSDGVLTPVQLVEHAKRQGLDFFAITDHNTWTYPDVAEADRHGDVAIIPGVEVTMPFGHFNAFAETPDLPEWIERLVTDSFETDEAMPPGSSAALVADVLASGFRASICHPLLSPWSWTDFDVDVAAMQYVEVWNSPTWPENLLANPAAVDLWTRWLNAGVRATAIGGSDFHNPELVVRADGRSTEGDIIGQPATYVFAESTSATDLLGAADEGRAYVSMGPTLTMRGSVDSREVGIGDVVEPTDQLDLEVVVTSELEVQVELVVAGQRTPIVNGLGQVGWQGSLPFEADWVRVDVRSQGELVAVSNPIFSGHAKSGSVAYGDVA